MAKEVRFDRMVPSQMVARRNACNLAYLPVGTLEWHGPHMPFGTDYITVTHVAEEAAKRFGGVVFAPIYYGDVRYILQECREEWRMSAQKDLVVPDEFVTAFPLKKNYVYPTQPDDGPPPIEPLEFSEQGQELLFAKHIAMVMLEIHLYGFKHIILLPGHGPNAGFCAHAEEMYAENVLRRSAFGAPARTLTWHMASVDREYEPLLKNHWIHADKSEASITAAAQPGTVHPECLPQDRKQLVPGYLGDPYLNETNGYNPAYEHIWFSFDALDPRNGISAQYGQRIIDGVLGNLEKSIAGLMRNAENIQPQTVEA